MNGLKRRIILVVAILVAILPSSFLIVFNYSSEEQNPSEFLVGVQVGYGSSDDCKAIVDRVKNYTNLVVLSSMEVTGNEAVLNETCDYIYDAGLKFFIFFLENLHYPYDLFVWFLKAKETYGDYFVGAYFLDEVGGKVLDRAEYHSSRVAGASSYTLASKEFTNYINDRIGSYFYLSDYADFSVITSDYGLYWFDYKAGYDMVLVHYGWNHSRPLNTALCRGAANVQNKDWGVTITWTYNHPPYMESGAELYDDLVLAYTSGAKYAVVFNYAESDEDPYGRAILADEHYQAIEDFWNYVQNNPEKHGSLKGEVALVLPQDYGFGFRRPDDTIWGMDEADHWTRKMWEDTNNLVDEYGLRLDIVYSDPDFNQVLSDYYDEVFFWNSGAETNSSYTVLNLNSSLGYSTIQEAINSRSTCDGDTIFVKSGTYRENVVIQKSITLKGEDKETTILDGGNNGTVVGIIGQNVSVSGFTIRNSGSNKSDAGVHLIGVNSTFSDNIITSNHLGIQLSFSVNNTFRNNNMFDNEYNFGVSSDILSSFVNDIDTSNTVDGKPIIYWVNEHDKTVPSDSGFVALINCTGITVQNLELENNFNGLVLVNTQKSTISGNVLADNYEGISLVSSSDNLFRDNTFSNCIHSFNVNNGLANDIDTSNTINGKPIIYWVNEHDKTVPVDAGYVALINCTGITVQNLNLINSGQGILLSYTTNSVISKNTITNQRVGIELFASSNNTISENRITSSDEGIKLEKASYNTVINNNLEANEAGFNAISSNLTIFSGNKLTNCTTGIQLGNSSNNTIYENALTANDFGIQFALFWDIYPPYNMIFENLITLNGYIIYPDWRTENNTFYHNNFINNTNSILLSSNELGNSWDNGVEGNYWNDYIGIDSDGDGIGDTPHIISVNIYYWEVQDNFPLMNPIEIP